MKLNPPPRKRLRVHELAAELGWRSRQLLEELSRRGEFVKSASRKAARRAGHDVGREQAELIDRQKSWTGRAEVERETASWVHWYNTTRRRSSLGYLSPVDYENATVRPSPPRRRWLNRGLDPDQDGSFIGIRT